MEEITKILKKMQIDMAEQKQEMREVRDSINLISEKIDTKFQALEIKYNNLELKVENQDKQIERLERIARQKNLVFFGMKETENFFDLQNMMFSLINNQMGIKCEKPELEFIRRMGKKGETPRPVVVTFSTFGKRMEVLRNKKKWKEEGCYIMEDLTLKALAKRKELKEELENIKKDGKRAFIKYDKIVLIPEKNTEALKSNEKKRYLSLSPEASNSTNNTQEPESIPATKKNKYDISRYIHTTKRDE